MDQMDRVHLVSGCGQDKESLNRMINEASVIVCSTLVEKKIRAMIPRGKEIMVDDRRLDKAGIERSVQTSRILHIGILENG